MNEDPAKVGYAVGINFIRARVPPRIDATRISQNNLKSCVLACTVQAPGFQRVIHQKIDCAVQNEIFNCIKQKERLKYLKIAVKLQCKARVDEHK